MAEDTQDKSQKTEEPTPKRLEEALKKGQIASSREINNFFILLAFAVVLLWLVPPIMGDATMIMSHFIIRPESYAMDSGNLGQVMADLIGDIAVTVFPVLLTFVIAALTAGTIQNRFVFSAEPITPKLEKISPLKGIKRLFSMRSIIEFLKGILKMIVVGVVSILVIWPDLNHLLQLPNMNTMALLDFMKYLAIKILIAVCIIMFFVAIVDYMYQRYEYIKNMRMSKQEIKDEYKQQEGDPIVKQRLRQIRMERAQKRMMSAVPSADVIITNPTHYSVALKYESAQMQAPLLVAKGVDKVALRIREVAEDNDIPLVENPPLARALYESVDIDDEIPFEHYQAVAEVIGYVYRSRGKTHGK